MALDQLTQTLETKRVELLLNPDSLKSVSLPELRILFAYVNSCLSAKLSDIEAAPVSTRIPRKRGGVGRFKPARLIIGKRVITPVDEARHIFRPAIVSVIHPDRIGVWVLAAPDEGGLHWKETADWCWPDEPNSVPTPIESNKTS